MQANAGRTDDRILRPDERGIVVEVQPKVITNARLQSSSTLSPCSGEFSHLGSVLKLMMILDIMTISLKCLTGMVELSCEF